MSLVPEQWEVLGTRTENGLRVAYIGRKKTDTEDRITVFKLVRRPKGWYNFGQWISVGRFRLHHGSDPVTRPLKLSDSRTDRTLRTLAEQAWA
jgi:hypothetical protein